eukprot:616140-Prorocentrum_minimum.AAC.2
MTSMRTLAVGVPYLRAQGGGGGCYRGAGGAASFASWRASAARRGCGGGCSLHAFEGRGFRAWHGHLRAVIKGHQR